MSEVKIKARGKISLAEKCPELVKEWDYEKNSSVKPENVTKGSHIKIDWKCKLCGYEWNTTVYHRTRGHGCPKCGNIKKGRKNNENKLKKMQYIEKTDKAS